MKKSVFILMIVLSISCGNSQEKDGDLTPEEMKMEEQNSPNQKPVTNEKLRKLSLQEANQLFDTPLQTDQFNVNGGLPEFRIGLYNFYKENDNVEIFEATWTKNDTTNITVWYAEKNEDWLPVDLLEWTKGTDF